MHYNERRSNPDHNIAAGTHSKSVSATLTRDRPDRDTVMSSKSLVVLGARAGKCSAGALRRRLASQKFEDFLEGFFAVLAIVYFVAAATFAGVLIGNAFGS